jgi:hypothetical protein
MRIGRVLLASALIVFISATNVSGQSAWRVDAYGGMIPRVNTGLADLDDASENASALLGASVQRAIGRSLFAVEGDVWVARGFLEGGSAESIITSGNLTVVSASLIARVPSSHRLRPYGALGLSSVHYSLRDRLSAVEQRSRLLGFVAGAGASFDIAPPLSIRGDVRYLRTQRSAAGALFEDVFIDVVRIAFGAGIEW